MILKQRYFISRWVMHIVGILSVWGDLALARVASDSPLGLEEPQFLSPEGGSSIIKTNKWDHNFTCTFGMAKGSWFIDQFGPISQKHYDSEAFFGKFQYSFHLPLLKNLGYVLGSSFGYYWERQSDQDDFHRVSAIHFPGVHLGMVYNFTPYFRILGGVETYIERLDDLAIRSIDTNGKQLDRKISLTMRPNFDWIFAADAFYSGSWGLRLEWHIRRVINTPPAVSNGQVIGAQLTKKDTWVGLGLIFHLFAT